MAFVKETFLNSAKISLNFGKIFYKPNFFSICKAIGLVMEVQEIHFIARILRAGCR
jgi:hypothetical protein